MSAGQPPIIRNRTEDVFFVHNCFGSFFRGVLDWIDHQVYPKFNQRVIGTYDKAIEFFQKKKEYHREQDTKITPCITLDPMYDFSNEERAGRFLWQFSRYAPGIGMRLFRSIDLKEQDILVTPVFSRYQGTFEVIMWLDSIYELMDVRTVMLQLCGGFGRWLRPEYFWSYIIFPERIENFEDEYGYKLDWGNTYADYIHVDTINKQRLAVPIGLDAMWKLDSFNDSSSKYGADRLAEYKMSATFTYEVNLPTYMVLSNKVDPVLKLSLSLGNAYTKYPLVSPYKILKAVSDVPKPEVSNILSKNYSLYKITDDAKEATNLVLEFPKSCLRYPLISMYWNHISAGKLVVINDEVISQPNFNVEKSDVIYFDTYKDSYLPYLRRCKAAISGKDTKVSKFYSKCLSLQKPMICHIPDEQQTKIKEYDGQDMTLDPYRRKLYIGLLESDKTESDPLIAYEVLEEVKQFYPELYDEAVKSFKGFGTYIPENYAEETLNELPQRLITDSADGFSVRYPLGFRIQEDSVASLKVYINDEYIKSDQYTLVENNETIEFLQAPIQGSKIHIGGELLIIKNSELVGIYEFTEEDEKTVALELNLPKPLTNEKDLVLVSYPGLLKVGVDYDIDMERQIVKLVIKPKEHEMVQFFYYSVQ